jgi:hypothetical protein
MKNGERFICNIVQHSRLRANLELRPPPSFLFPTTTAKQAHLQAVLPWYEYSIHSERALRYSRVFILVFFMIVELRLLCAASQLESMGMFQEQPVELKARNIKSSCWRTIDLRSSSK